MRSTFFGFEIAKSGIQASQSGLDVTGQNVTNVNTEGFTRLALNQSSADYFSSAYKYGDCFSSFGQGVTIDEIAQVRDQFLDARYRRANSQFTTLSTNLSILKNIESVFDETINDGLFSMLGDFYGELQSLSANAGDVVFSSVTRSAAQKVTETLNQYSNQLSEIREQEQADLAVVVDDVNTIVGKINDLNQSIKNEMVYGNPSGELLDMRNNYLDELSGYLDVTITANPDGTVSVSSGEEMLLDALNNQKISLGVSYSSGEVSIVKLSTGELFDVTQGKIKGYLEALNGLGSYAASGQESGKGLAYYEKVIDDFAVSFASRFNDLNKPASGEDRPLFEGDSAGVINAKTIRISASWQQDANYITASQNASAPQGSNDNIIRMINAMDSDTVISDYFTGTFEDYITSVMGDIAVGVNYCNDVSNTAEMIKTSVENQRESVMGVSLNEETANLLRYQKAFEASSRLMTVLDEALDVIINRMGVVGR